MLKEAVALTDSYRRSLNLATQNSWHEVIEMSEGRLPWHTYYDSTVGDYDREFASVADTTISQLLTQRRSEKGQVFAMDAMGTLDFSKASRVDGQVVITLVDFRDPQQRQEDSERMREVYTGSAITTAPILQAKRFISTHDISAFPGFDLITRRPLLGYTGVADLITPKPHKHDATRAMLQRDISLLSYGGTLRAQMPFHEDYTEWFSRLEEVEGLETRGGLYVSEKMHDRNVVQIRKYTHKRVVLPQIENVGRLRKPTYAISADGTYFPR